MLNMCFQNIFILGSIISILTFPIIYYLSKNKLKYNISSIYKIFFIISFVFLLPILKSTLNNINLPTNIKKFDYNIIGEEIKITDNVIKNYYVEEIKPINYITIKNSFLDFINQYISYVWFGIASTVFIFHIFAYAIYIFTLNLERKSNKEINDFLDKLKNELDINQNVQVVYSNNITSPISIGIIRKKIILPQFNFSYIDLECFLRHELYHIKNHDIEYKYFLMFLKSIYFFNPIILYFIKTNEEIIELNCDNEVLFCRDMNYRITYGNVLLNQIEKNNSKNLIVNFSSDRRKIMDRFNNIIKKEKNKNISFIALTLTIILIVAIIIAVIAPNVNFANTNTNSLENVNNNISIKNEVNNNTSVIDNFNNETINNLVNNQISESNSLVENNSKEVEQPQVDIIVDSVALQEISETEIKQKEPEKAPVLVPEKLNNTNLIKPLKISVTPISTFNGTIHCGIDFPAKEGTEIIASQSGKVIVSKYDGGYGNMIIIEHENGLFTVYAQCSKLLVKENEQVTQGQVIAEVGSTGNSTGPHLHFEVRKNAIAQDPAEYISF